MKSGLTLLWADGLQSVIDEDLVLSSSIVFGFDDYFSPYIGKTEAHADFTDRCGLYVLTQK